MNQHLPANPGDMPTALANRQRRSIVADASHGLGVSRPAHVSIEGGKFTLVNAAGARMLIPTHHMDCVIIDASSVTSRIYYAGDPTPGNNAPPVCYSDNGTGPSINSVEPQSPLCETCPQNIRGSDTTFTGKATTACQRKKKVALIIPGDPACNVYELQIPPGSLGGWRSYCQWIGTQTTGARATDIADFITRISWDTGRMFVMVFQPVGWADDPVTLSMIEYVDANKLSDAAVGRGDVACNPEQVALMISQRGSSAALPAPAQVQQFQLPPRTTTGAAAAPGVMQHPFPPTPALPSPQQPAQAWGPAGPAPSDQAATPAWASASTPEKPAQGRGRPRKPREAPETQTPAPTTGWSAPAQQPNTRLQEPASFNPAPAPAPQQQFGMVQGAPSPPPGVADALRNAMNMLPPQQR
jgi:hypothetical protein